MTEVLHTQSISLTRRDDGISEPGLLRRIDGSSVYTVAGSELFTSTRILEAEQRLVATAARTDGRVVDASTVELALLEAAANGNALDAGQAALVRAMCTSGARLHLAIAPGWRWEDHRHVHPGSGVGRQRRRGARAGAVRRRSCATPRRHRCTGRNAGKADLVHPPMTCPNGRNASTGPAW